ncbi:hypothetical protein [Roseibacillus ishigakijimensis]|uniref:Uncharacterized protein n=1 Tax=Roseibacillus ishigakijimensis TaxID=454146 RepID=A0A934RML1_9BACT|nr:hypothetical protein [Roseibacillus ishigakijimensis]MBK1834164.1 hypothetical protein [Roseibacillus ishigakijimensis]
MSFFDLLFPEWAAATHLRTLTEQNRLPQSQARLSEARAQRLAQASRRDLEQGVKALEQELGQAALVMEALLEKLAEKLTEKLTEKDLASRGEMMDWVREIDARDGCVDGRMSPPKAEPFEPRRSWEEARKAKLISPEEG